MKKEAIFGTVHDLTKKYHEEELFCQKVEEFFQAVRL